MGIGDVFIIFDKNKGKSRRNIDGVNYFSYTCKDPNKKFIIKRISGSNKTIYYDDNRTNNSCKCHNCRGEKEKSIHYEEILIVETKFQRERDIKLKLILGRK